MQVHEKYPLYVAPANLVAKDKDDWSEAEATEYKDWLLESLDERVCNLLVFLDVPKTGVLSEHLLVVGQKAVSLLRSDPFFAGAESGVMLTDAGMALAADLGLLIAKCLVDLSPSTIRWHLLRKPKKELAFNLPVLTGFSNGNYIDPIGGMIAEAQALLRGERSEKVWKQTYEYWAKLV